MSCPPETCIATLLASALRFFHCLILYSVDSPMSTTTYVHYVFVVDIDAFLKIISLFLYQ